MLNPIGSGDRWPLDRGAARVDEAKLRNIHLPGFLSAVDVGGRARKGNPAS
jgi:hypothetical protein